MDHRQTTVILMLVFVGQDNKRVNLMAKILKNVKNLWRKITLISAM